MAEWALNSWFSPESYSIDPGLSLPKRRPVGFADLKFEPSLCHVLARHSVLCFWWSCYCCDMFISFLVTLLLLIQCIPVGLSPVLVAKRYPPLCWASSIFCCFQLLAKTKHILFFEYTISCCFTIWWSNMALEYPPFQIDFLSSVCFSCDFVSFSPKEASHRKRRQRSRKRSMVWLCAAMWCRTLDGWMRMGKMTVETIGFGKMMPIGSPDLLHKWPWNHGVYIGKIKHIPGCLTRCPISSDIPNQDEKWDLDHEIMVFF